MDLPQDGPKVDSLKSAGVKYFAGSTTDAVVVSEAVRGCEVAVHCAALMDDSLPWDAIMEANVKGGWRLSSRHPCVSYSDLGTSVVATEAKAAGVRTFIFLSSVMVYGFIFLPDTDESGVLNGT